ncbi:PadR family transcriptional regulator [Pseudalkalibacillus hwajinpoensis]|uniref:PadR family transcriptional regulator n=1 Tax=Guptibacillus hwajinpoensis TaxID=208199 RepID=A0A4U1MGU1_9BACL|nr:PadR family transcriptional regulator [Pseudalkalibacillus hwajinpoensis]TKD69937.1 PadR family transcriptional regulator [Pseudalkalibacillus hwajinpoensis]
MALRYALLGLLTKKPSTGYELTQQFKETMIHFWSAHHTQIYRELGKMEKEQLVSFKIVPQEDLPDKKIYSIEERGYNQLIEWLAHHTVDPPKMKNEQLMRVSLFHLIPKDEAIQFLEKSKEHHQMVLQHMDRWKEEHGVDKHIQKDRLGEYLTLEYGRRQMRTWIEWCDWAIEFIDVIIEEQGEDN